MRAYEPIQFPDTEALLVDYLTAEFGTRGESATVHTRVPHPRPQRFVVVPRVGGVRRNLVVDSPTIGVECWAMTDGQAWDLCSLTHALTFALKGRVVGGVQFYEVGEFAGPANLPDSVSVGNGSGARSRYVFTVSISVRGTAI